MFSYQGSCRSFQATACIDYHSTLLLSRTFFRPLSTLFFSRHLPMAVRLPPVVPPPRLRPAGFPEGFLRHQRQVLSYHHRKELSTFFLFFIYFRQFTQFQYILLLFCTFTLFIISSDHNFLLPLFSINILLYSAKESTDEITYWKLGSVLHISSAPVK